MKVRKGKRDLNENQTNKASSIVGWLLSMRAICNEMYEDPPREVWIQCSICKERCHEACSDYENMGLFHCSYCWSGNLPQ
jgi:hypothetical protein